MARGVAAPMALRAAGSPVVRVGGSGHPLVIVYPWVTGEMLAPGSVAPERAARIGDLLACIHASDSDALGQEVGPWPPPAVQTDGMLLLTRRAERLDLAWAADARRRHRDIVLAYAQYRMTWLLAMMRQAASTGEALATPTEHAGDPIMRRAARAHAGERLSEHATANVEVACALMAIERLLAGLDQYARWLAG